MTLPPNLFKPGAGSHPPHLAGRDGEIRAMAPTEAAIEARAAPAADVILHGPRGNGKTVLLDVVGDRLEQAGAQIVRATAHEELASWRALANALASDDGWRGALRRLSEQVGGRGRFRTPPPWRRSSLARTTGRPVPRYRTRWPLAVNGAGMVWTLDRRAGSWWPGAWCGRGTAATSPASRPCCRTWLNTLPECTGRGRMEFEREDGR